MLAVVWPVARNARQPFVPEPDVPINRRLCLCTPLRHWLDTFTRLRCQFALCGFLCTINHYPALLRDCDAALWRAPCYRAREHLHGTEILSASAALPFAIRHCVLSAVSGTGPWTLAPDRRSRQCSVATSAVETFPQSCTRPSSGSTACPWRRCVD